MQTVETLNEGLKRAYRITISAKDIDARVDQELKSIAPQVRMPGFRPGKVPANLVRKMHGAALRAAGAAKRGPGRRPAAARPSRRSARRCSPQVALEEGGGPARMRSSPSRSRPCPTCPSAEDRRPQDRAADASSRRPRRSTRRSTASPTARRASIRRRPSTRRRRATSSSSISRARSTASRSTAARARACRSSSARAG